MDVDVHRLEIALLGEPQPAVIIGQDLLGLRQDLFSSLGQGDPGPVSGKEGDADLIFKQFQGLGQAGLGHVQLLGGFVDGMGFRQDDKVFQRLQFQGFSPIRLL